MVDRVVVPLDDSRRSQAALDVGTALRDALGARLHLVSVVAAVDEVETRRAALATAVPGADVSVLVDDAPAEALLGFLDGGENDVCCMATHARGAVTEMVVGSVAQRMVHAHSGPVVLVGPHHAGKWSGPVKSVLACVDGSPLSEQVLAPAVRFARAMKVDLQLVQVLKPEATALSEGQDAAEWAYLRRTAERLKRDSGIDVQWDVLHGDDPAEAVSGYADAMPGALVAMTTHGRSGLSRLTLGSVAQRVVHESVGPVWVIRPASEARS